LQSLSELRKLRHHYPELWGKLKSWDEKTWRKFRADYSVKELETRFDFEDECIRLGKPIKGKAFYTELRERLKAS
ncbi:MAG TPA: 3'-phosphoadenosine 5'-phosphosulfate sulfotransferase (PAPS reductase)/FAD synthetase, partial [Clostridiales bacterium]|nr:3'-phosphoadenosine 5'-phosphosulfate sulfotransferase (PAPS reductase)/FAD synthetase [Clostridiales bacterium]